MPSPFLLFWQHSSLPGQHSKGPDSTMITLFCNEKILRVLSPSSPAPPPPPPQSIALALYPQYIIVVTAQRQASLNYSLERSPLYVVRGDPDGDGTLGHMVWGLLEPYRLDLPLFLLYLLSNYHQTWYNSTMAQNLSRAVKVKSIMTSL